MRIRALISLLVLLVLIRAEQSDSKPITYFVQLVRGCDSDTPPEPNSRRIGATLQSHFQGPLKWKSFWEVTREEVAVAPGNAKNVSLGHACRVRIDLGDRAHRTVTVFKRPGEIEANTMPIGSGMTVVGGARDAASAWFVVVRRDQP